MGPLTSVAVLGRPDMADVTAITDLDIAVSPGGAATLYATSRSGKAITAFDVSGGGARFLDRQGLTSDTTAVDIVTAGPVTYVMTTGPQSAVPQAYVMQPDGKIGGTAAAVRGAPGAPASGLVTVDTPGGAYVYGADTGAGQAQAFRTDAAGTLTYIGAKSTAMGTSRLFAAKAEDGTLIAVTADGAHVVALQAERNGALTERGMAGASQGLGVSQISAVETVEVLGETYVILGARGSSSLSVLRLGDDGTLTPVSHVFDDLHTRFQNLTALDVVAVGDRAYVIAGGADDGMSVFTLLPGGRLLHLHSVADTFSEPLQNVSAVAAHARGNALDIFVGSAIDAGLGHYRMTLDTGQTRIAGDADTTITGGGAADIIDGAGGNDVLNGAGGDDVILDGTGEDRMTGGAGSDVFVLAADGARDEITDFNFHFDTLDLSGWQMLRSAAQLDIKTRGNGAEITYRDEVLRLVSHDRSGIDPANVIAAISFGPAQMPVGSPGPAETIRGTDGKDTVAGNDVDNRLFGEAGDDRLIGGEGADVLWGGRGDDVLEGGPGADLLNGEDRDGPYDSVAGQVYRLYRATLDREPDQAGHAGWSQRIRDGERTQVEVANAFLQSAEFQRVYGATSHGQFVRLLYENVLDRAPDADGQSFWVDELRTGNRSRAEVVLGFSNSPEFVAATEVDVVPWTRAGGEGAYSGEVYRLYRATLDRDPDVVGFRHWATKMAEGMSYVDVAYGFTNSREFTQTYGSTTDRQFVTLLYDNVLDRAPDVAGLNHWIGKLQSGTSREQVVRGFAESTEFKENTVPQFASWIDGRGFNDRLLAKGDDVLFGGVGADTFVFDAREKAEVRVLDLDPWDVIEIEGSGFSSRGQAAAAVRQAGPDAVLQDGDLTIRFEDTQAAQIALQQFDLV